MKRFLFGLFFALCASVSHASILPARPKPPKTAALVEKGRVVYFERCSFCHGLDGGGDGPTAEFLNPRPRNFKTNIFKFRTTGSGKLPTDEDLFKTISRGVPGTAMQGFDNENMKSGLTEEERWAVIYLIQTFRAMPDFSLWDFDEEAAKSSDPETREEYRYNHVLKTGEPPPLSAEKIAEGKEVFHKAKCFQCHGERGLGNGESAEGMTDNWKFPILPRDLTKGWKYKHGKSVKDIFTTITTGFNGSPMPSFASALSKDERWTLAWYVKSLIYRPVSENILKVKKIEGELPETPADPLWNEADVMDVRLAGNVLVKPRWQNITIDLVRVKALFNEKEIALRLEWHDRFADTVHEGSDELHQLDNSRPGEEGDLQTYVPIYSPDYKPKKYRDALMVQFPQTILEGTRKPHFLNGDPNDPVNLWWWRADYDARPAKGRPSVEMNATGFSNPFRIQPEVGQSLFSKAVYEDGVWTLVLKRALKTPDENDIQFETGRFIPIAINGWDGSNHDTGMRKSISSWHFLYLEKPTPLKVYYLPLVTLLLLAGCEVWLLRKWAPKKS